MAAIAPSQVLYEPQYDGALAPLANVYEPVEEGLFRILQLDGLDENGVLNCLLLTRRFEEASYTAVSYTWNPNESIWYGPPTTTNKAIRINGLVVAIRSKVADILCLMHRLGRGMVWIDGLCINQEDSEDKQTQVNQMSLVYRSADEVIPIIGSPTAETDFLLDRDIRVSESLMSQHFHRLHKAVLIFGANGYWRRAWVLQEIVLGKKLFLCCGRRLVSFDDLFELLTHLENTFLGWFGFLRQYARWLRVILQADKPPDQGNSSRADGGPFDGDAMKIFRQKKRARYREMNFLKLLETSSRYNRCSDPKDMLYARRSLAADGITLIPTTDYSKETSFEQVYKDFARQCIMNSASNCLDIILEANWYPYRKPSQEKSRSSKSHALFPEPVGLPSWVPDWRVYRKRTYIPDVDINSDGSILKLRWSDDSKPTISPNGNDLTVRGRIIHMITDTDVVLFRKSVSIFDRAAKRFEIRFYPNIHHAGKGIFGAPAPVAGDLICALSGCPALVFLHNKQGSDKYEITGKENEFQFTAVQHCLKDIVLYVDYDLTPGHSRINVWSFRDIGKINSLPEKSFTIV